MGQAKFLIALAFIAVFSLAVTGYVINFANDNNVAIDMGGDSDIIVLNSTTQGNLTTLKSESSDSSSAFFKATESDQTEKTPGQFKFGFFEGIALVTSAITLGFKKIFGSGTIFGIVITTFTAVIGLLAAMYIWKTLKGGNPD